VRLSFANPVPLPRFSDLGLDVRLVREAAVQEGSRGFLRLQQLEVRIDGEDPFPYDAVTRHAMDAVVIAAHFRKNNEVHVVLVSAVRPPLRLRNEPAVLWELPAGLVEPGETFPIAAARELFEETGLHVTESGLHELGAYMYPTAAILPEKHVFFHAEIDWDAREEAPGDCSPLERVQQAATISLDEALELCARGEIRDSKSELALRRLEDVVRKAR
jgi:8-oxo-dGTP pyrophosphatase MutT (NUDIX family)